MTTRHTPGPWAFDDAGNIAYVSASDSHICKLEGRTVSTDKANGRLIAAAPDLLEALELLYANPDSIRGATRARRAIAKAKGD